MSQYKYIIWDLDGTLLDTVDDLTDSVNVALLAHQLPPKTKQEVASYLGNGIMRLIELAINDGKNNPKFESVFKMFKTHYQKNSNHKTRPYEGIMEVLFQLKSHGFEMAIVSNKIDSEVQRLSQHYFQEVIDKACGESDTVKRKPAPDMVINMMTQMNAKPLETVYIGDSEVDITTAANANIDCISVTWGFRDQATLQAAGAKKMVDSPLELLDYLMQ